MSCYHNPKGSNHCIHERPGCDVAMCCWCGDLFDPGASDGDHGDCQKPQADAGWCGVVTNVDGEKLVMGRTFSDRRSDAWTAVLRVWLGDETRVPGHPKRQQQIRRAKRLGYRVVKVEVGAR